MVKDQSIVDLREKILNMRILNQLKSLLQIFKKKIIKSNNIYSPDAVRLTGLLIKLIPQKLKYYQRKKRMTI